MLAAVGSAIVIVSVGQILSVNGQAFPGSRECAQHLAEQSGDVLILVHRQPAKAYGFTWMRVCCTLL